MKVTRWNLLQFVLCALLAFQLTGCGYILYPERRGQTGGRVDPSVVILDAIGLLFFLVPGVVAFAVDFSSGTVYYPHSRRRYGFKGGDQPDQAHFDPKHTTHAQIEKMVFEHTGVMVKLDGDGVNVVKLKSLADMNQRFAQLPVAMAALAK